VWTPGTPGGMGQGIGEARTTGDDVHAEGAEQVGEGAASRVRDIVEKAEQARASRRREGLGVGVAAIAGRVDRRGGADSFPARNGGEWGCGRAGIEVASRAG
jgi:hypothetical protein